MQETLPIRAHIILSLVWSLILLWNTFFLQSSTLGWFFGVLYVVSIGVAMRRRMFPDEPTFSGVILGIIAVFALFIIISTGAYWIVGYRAWVVFSLIIIIPLIIARLPARERMMCPVDNSILLTMSTSGRTIYGMFIFFLQILLFYMLWSTETVSSVITVWDVLSHTYLYLFFFTTVLLIHYFVRPEASKGVFLIATHAILMTSLAVFVFPLGFGFDPFIHRTALLHIFQEGILEPKTPYYTGMYTTLVGIGHVISAQTMLLFERLLVPIFAPIMIIVTSAFSLRKAGAKRFVPIMSLVFFVVPMQWLIMTTPQALANTFFVLMLLGAITTVHKRRAYVGFMWLCALAGMAIHPLSGIPAVMFASAVHISHVRRSMRHYVIAGIIMLGGAVALPLVMIIAQHGFSDVLVHILNGIGIPHFPWNLSFVHAFEPRLHLLYSGRFLLGLLLLTIVLLSIVQVFKTATFRRFNLMFLSLSAILFINAVILSNGIDISNVIAYEQRDFSERVMQLCILALIPLFMSGTYYVCERLQMLPRFVYRLSLIFGALFFTTSLYFLYPQHTPYERDRGYTVSQDDFETVRTIEERSGEPYIVLANQAVSSVGLYTFGFERYLPSEYGELYFYPIPTGGVMYSYYLDVVQDAPARDIVQEAMEVAGVKKLFVVLSPYWWNADALAIQLEAESDGFFSVDGNRVFEFAE